MNELERLAENRTLEIVVIKPSTEPYNTQDGCMLLQYAW